MPIHFTFTISFLRVLDKPLFTQLERESRQNIYAAFEVKVIAFLHRNKLPISRLHCWACSQLWAVLARTTTCWRGFFYCSVYFDTFLAEGIRPWTVVEQRSLERALRIHPARPGEPATDRWQRIADEVGTRTRRECMLRFKDLAEQVRTDPAPTPPTAPFRPGFSSLQDGERGEDVDSVIEYWGAWGSGMG